MRNCETAWQFQTEREFGKHKLRYINVSELGMDGPTVGNVTIDDTMISSAIFGGPPISDGVYLYIPEFQRNLFSSGFKICKVNMETLQNRVYGELKPVIALDRIENNIIYYFADRNQTKQLTFTIPI